MVLSPDFTAMRAMRAVWERAEARIPRSGFTTGGFHSSTCRRPRGAPLSVTLATAAPTRRSASSWGFAMVAEVSTKIGSLP